MRQLTAHRIPGAAAHVDVFVEPQLGNGGAPFRYYITAPIPKAYFDGMIPLTFQQGNPADGMNGITNEALMAIVLDRLENFQRGPFKCTENAEALTHLQEAIMWLQKRTRDRMAREVEGTFQH